MVPLSLRQYLMVRYSSTKEPEDVWVCTASLGAHAFVGAVPLVEGRPQCWVPDCPGRHFMEERQFEHELAIAPAA